MPWMRGGDRFWGKSDRQAEARTFLRLRIVRASGVTAPMPMRTIVEGSGMGVIRALIVEILPS